MRTLYYKILYFNFEIFRTFIFYFLKKQFLNLKVNKTNKCAPGPRTIHSKRIFCPQQTIKIVYLIVVMKTSQNLES